MKSKKQKKKTKEKIKIDFFDFIISYSSVSV
jgi:hypothetical protein